MSEIPVRVLKSREPSLAADVLSIQSPGGNAQFGASIGNTRTCRYESRECRLFMPHDPAQSPAVPGNRHNGAAEPLVVKPSEREPASFLCHATPSGSAPSRRPATGVRPTRTSWSAAAPDGL